MTDWFSIPNPSASRELRKSKNYEGLRVNLVARLERARIHMQIDIGFGDVIVPPPKEIQYPALLNFPSPSHLSPSHPHPENRRVRHRLLRLGLWRSEERRVGKECRLTCRSQ